MSGRIEGGMKKRIGGRGNMKVNRNEQKDGIQIISYQRHNDKRG